MPHRPAGALARACAATLLVAALAGCTTGGTGEGVAALKPRDGRSGLQLSGTVEGAHVVANAGAPELLIGDCDPNDGFDRDVCFLTDDIHGDVFVLSIENPAVLAGGATYDVVADCATPERCDGVTDGVVIDLQVGVGERLRVSGGTLHLEALEPLRRYRGRVTLDLADGRLSGTFDVVPRPDVD